MESPKNVFTFAETKQGSQFKIALQSTVMIYLKDRTLDQIRLAKTETEIESVIDGAFSKLQRKNVNAHLIKNYVMTMTLSLLTLKRQSPTSNGDNNVTKALEIFRRLNRSKNYSAN